MSFYQRLRYSLYLAAIGGAIAVLLVAVAVADVVSLLPPTIFDLLMSPGYLVVILALAFLATPVVARRSVLWQPYVPLSALLPHATALVHRGGFGTAAETLRSGPPQPIAPFA